MTEPLPLEHAQVSVAATHAAQHRIRCGSDPAAISAAMAPAFGVLMGYVHRHGLQPTAPPRAIYTAHGPQGTEITLAQPVLPPAAALPAGDVAEVGELPAARALRFTHRGPYRELIRTYGRINAYMHEQGLLRSDSDWAKYMPMWEEYANDPDTTPEAELLTYIYIPLDCGLSPG